jgi:hypothetical protein
MASSRKMSKISIGYSASHGHVGEEERKALNAEDAEGAEVSE